MIQCRRADLCRNEFLVFNMLCEDFEKLNGCRIYCQKVLKFSRDIFCQRLIKRRDF